MRERTEVPLPPLLWLHSTRPPKQTIGQQFFFSQWNGANQADRQTAKKERGKREKEKNCTFHFAVPAPVLASGQWSSLIHNRSNWRTIFVERGTHSKAPNLCPLSFSPSFPAPLMTRGLLLLILMEMKKKWSTGTSNSRRWGRSKLMFNSEWAGGADLAGWKRKRRRTATTARKIAKKG